MIGSSLSRTFAALSVRNFRIFALGGVVSNTGTWMQRVAQDWLVLQLTHGSASAVGITTGLQFLPFLLFGLYGGVLADRYPKRLLLVITQAALGLQALVLGVLTVTGAVQTWHVYLLAFLMGCVTVVDSPVRQAFVIEMVGTEQLTNAVALNSASFNTARLVGPAIAGLLVVAIGSGWVVLLNAVSFGAVIVSVLFLRASELHPAPVATRTKGQLLEGLRYVRGQPELVAMLAVVFFVSTFGLNFQMTLALFASSVFHRQADGYGYLSTALAVGTLAGALLAARRGQPRRRVVLQGAVAFGAFELIAGLMPTYDSFLLMLVPTGVASLTFITAANATVQLTAGPEMRGRVMALYGVVFLGGAPLGAPLLGWLSGLFGPRTSLVAGGLVSVAAGLVGVAAMARRQRVVVRPHLAQWPPHLEVARLHERIEPGLVDAPASR